MHHIFSRFPWGDLRMKRSIEAALILGVVILIVWIKRQFLSADIPAAFFLNRDSTDINFPLFTYFFSELQVGNLPFYQPFLWGGARLFGDPNFQINPFQIVIGFIFGANSAIWFSSFSNLIGPIVAFLGFYALMRRLCPSLPFILAVLLAMAYVFSSGYAALQGFLTMSVHFATLPWIFLLLSDPKRDFSLLKLVALGGCLGFQFAYGQLQFSIYTCWLILGFILFHTPKGSKFVTFRFALLWGSLALLLSAYFLVPVIDNLYFNDYDSGARTSAALSVNDQIVPDFYLLRLFVPELFSPWWPIWRDNWSLNESFTAYQGLAVTMIAVYGLFLREVPIFFRGVYVFLLVATTYSIGILFLYPIHLGASVPFGRITMLLPFVAPIICAFTINEIVKQRKLATFFTLWCFVVFLGFAIVTHYGFPSRIISYGFNKATSLFGYNLDVVAFIDQYRDSFTRAIKRARNLSLFILILSLAHLFLKQKFAPKVAKTSFPSYVIFTLIASTAVYQCVTKFTRMVPTFGQVTESASVNQKHPAEIYLEKLVKADNSHFIRNRVHSDIYFGEQRQATISIGGKQIYKTHGANPKENRFRLLPNFLAGTKIPVLTGYSSVMPQEKLFSQIIMWNPAITALGRAVGERGHLHPGMLDLFSVKWVLRHQPEVISSITNSRPPWSTRSERYFIDNSTLIYEDDAYQIYQYLNSRPSINFPDRLAFGDDTVITLSKLESDNQWIPTAVVNTNLKNEFLSTLSSSEMNLNGVSVLNQSGTVLSAEAVPDKSIDIKVDAPDAALLLLGVKYDRWWKVYVNGKSAPLQRANGIYGAVVVPEGVSDVQVRLQPWSAWIGVGISSCTAATLFFLIALRGFRKRGGIKLWKV